MLKKCNQMLGSDILVLGFTFKNTAPMFAILKWLTLSVPCRITKWMYTFTTPRQTPRLQGMNTIWNCKTSCPSLPSTALWWQWLIKNLKAFESLNISSLIIENSVVFDVKGVMENGFDGKLFFWFSFFLFLKQNTANSYNKDNVFRNSKTERDGRDDNCEICVLHLMIMN